MASRAADIMDWLATQLATINGSSPYTYDLSGSGRIIIGSEAPTMAAISGHPATCFVTEFRTGTEPGPSLNQFMRTMEVDIAAFAATGDDLPLSRAKAAANLAADIDTALTGTSARRSGVSGLFRDAVTQSNTRDGNALGFKGCGIATLTITFTYTGSL